MVYNAVNQSEELTSQQMQMRPRYFTTKMRTQEIFTNLAKVGSRLLSINLYK
jgi:hypothetical protein